MMHRNPSVDVHQFAMVPRSDIPRSSFRQQATHKTTHSASYLVPVYVQEILPGDSFNLRMTAFSRTATPIYPIMDNMYLESFFFFVPCRLVWSNWVKFMGEQTAPGDSISFIVPTVTSAAGGFVRHSIYDYMGLPCAPNLGANTLAVNSLPLRAYNLIYQNWFKDENLGTTTPVLNTGDGPDAVGNYQLRVRGKRHDYFTSCLPFAQKGTAVSIPLGGFAPVLTQTFNTTPANPLKWQTVAGGSFTGNRAVGLTAGAPGASATYESATVTAVGTTSSIAPANLFADLSIATGATINALRLAFQTQKLLERDARGGTRYTEIVRSHFGVISPDARLQRPEYLGGGSSPVNVQPIAQQTQTGVTGGTTPLGTLGAIGASLHQGHGFQRAFTEHGYVLGLISVRADLTYQQGVRKLWSRSTRYDFFFPVFAALGEQSVLNKEIYCDGSANDLLTFGYQERWGEYRYMPSMTTSYFNSTNPTPLDAWHLAQKFTALPTLGELFINDPTLAILQRNLAAGAAADNQQFLSDIFFDVKCARPMPMYSVPGLIDHF